MGVASLDTLEISRDLRTAEFTQPQAEAVASAIGRAVQEGAATKADLGAVRIELKSDLSAFRAEFKADLAALRSEFKADLAEMKASLLTWFIGSQVALGALLVAALKL